MNLSEKVLKRNILSIYGITIFHNLIFAYVIERAFSLSRGMSIEMVAYTEVIYNFVVIALEIPSGYLADIWSRKKLMILAAFLTCIEFLILIFAHNFFMFAVATVATGIGKAFNSGAENAIFYDTLKKLGEEDSFQKHMSKLRFIDYTTGIIAALLGAYMAYKTSYTFNYALSLISCVLAFVCTLFLYDVSDFEKPIMEFSHNNRSYSINKNVKDMKEVLSFFIKNSYILSIALTGVIAAVITVQIDEFYQIYILDIGFPVYLFGVVSLFSLGACSFGSLLSSKSDKIFSKFNGYIMILCGLVISIVLLILSHNYLVVIPLFLYYLCYSVLEPVVLTEIHKNIKGKLRATTESFYSLMRRGMTMFIALPFGIIANRISLKIGFVFLAVALSLMIIVLLIIANVKNERNEYKKVTYNK
ncbi:MFS transporter [Oceanirhabdus sp. W0125-5]|uniref:MFS transporter n=1 Tax=Oceanirhabdus sp. W0125-5 TaxID=2999116 RepID=UPI0022F2CDBB|nr:MFS transporter [Oceanirhabdus sp. W0125-5]WBW95706.1 MFS transporter [Oceanirhabdus sp. W0125-5]